MVGAGTHGGRAYSLGAGLIEGALVWLGLGHVGVWLTHGGRGLETGAGLRHVGTACGWSL